MNSNKEEKIFILDIGFDLMTKILKKKSPSYSTFQQGIYGKRKIIYCINHRSPRQDDFFVLLKYILYNIICYII